MVIYDRWLHVRVHDDCPLENLETSSDFARETDTT
jgi:hypothetical protein